MKSIKFDEETRRRSSKKGQIMVILENIFSYYKEIGREIASFFGNDVVINYHKYQNEKPLSFIVTMEIIIPQLKAEDDYGLVLSTEAQKSSQSKSEVNSNNELFLISDISYGDGKVIQSSNEISFSFFDNISTNEALNFVRLFFSDNINFIKDELINHYGLRNG